MGSLRSGGVVHAGPRRRPDLEAGARDRPPAHLADAVAAVLEPLLGGVEIDEVLPNADREGVTDVHAVIYVERPGQKHILMGKDGGRMRVTVQKARKSLIELLGENVYLDLRIKVLKDWQSDPKQLGRLGF